jgi:hypothetical protein
MTLLVPVALDVLVVREPGETWARTAMQTPVDDGRSRRQRLAPPPFADLEQPRPAGVYLHWAIPDALTRAAPDTSPPAFPAVPDQWLVVRLSGPPRPGARGPRAVRTWRLPARPPAGRVPDPGAPGPGSPDTGVPVPGEGLPATPPLTALGAGDPAWSAAFDNVVGTWGLYDDAAGVPDGSVAYLVCGWYGEADLDPLAGASEATFWSRLSAFDWDLDPDFLDDLPVPRTCLFHGAAVGIGWPEERWLGGGVLGDELDLRPAAEDVEVGLADTVAAAVAALGDEDPTPPGPGATKTPGAATVAQRLVEASLTGLSADFARDDGPTRVDAALHAARFGHRPGRPVTEIVWRPGTTHPGTGPLDTGPLGGGPLGGGPLGGGPGGIDLPDPLEIPLGEFSRVSRPGPRVWHPADPAVALGGAGRGFTHGGDGRFTASGRLSCRTTGHTVTAVGARKGDPGAGAEMLDPADLADLGRGVPDECADLMVELAALDPGSAPDLLPPIGPIDTGPIDTGPIDTGGPPGGERPGPATGDPLPSPIAGARAALWALRLPWVDPDLLLESTRVVGTLPSPLALTPPSVPWTPYRLDWTVEYLPSPGGSHDWTLADLDFEPAARAVIPTAGRALTGTSVLTAHAAALAEQGLPGEPPGPVEAIVAAPPPPPQLDLLSAGLADLAARLRGDPLDPLVRPRGSSRFQPAPGPRPAGFLSFRAGWLRLVRLRLVDGFGRFLELVPGKAQVVTADSVDVPGRPGLSLFPPRFTAPARVSLRFTDGYGGSTEATDGISPVAGYLLPSPLEGAIEVFDDDGAGLGRLVSDDAAVTRWEPEPGTPAGIGSSPADTVGNPVLLGLVLSLLESDAPAAGAGPARHPTALESLRRVLDITRWTVDEVGVAGGEHLALLLGHPVVVVRAQIDLEVEDPRAPVENAARTLPVRLGVLGHLQDGLLGYVVGEEYDRVHVVDPVISELATDGEPLPDYVDAGDGFTVQPGSPLALTLLMVPGSQVHATTGLLPRKAVTLQRNWTADAMARISPTTSRGPVLRDPTATRLPVTGRVRGHWLWHRREDPVTWATDDVVPTTQEALLTPNLQLSDGWLQLDRAPDFTGELPLLTVTCVTTAATGEIEAVGIEQANGTHILVPVAQAAGLAAAGHVRLQSRRKKGPAVPVVPARRPDGRRFLEAPHDLGDALLDLPRCAL